MFRPFFNHRNHHLFQSLFKYFSTPSFNYDVCVIGGGPAGYIAAIKAAQKGLKTACVDNREQLGGTCINVGCIPSKALLNITQKFYEAKWHFKDFGINTGPVSCDLKQMMNKKNRLINGLTKGIEALFIKNKIDHLKGWGKFQDEKTILVEAEPGNGKVYRSKNFIIATGSEPKNLPGGILPTDEKRILSSTGALSLQEVPKKLVVIGGGVIGLELGSIYKRLGSEVEIVEFLDKILPKFDYEISSYFLNLLKKSGIKFSLGHKVVGGSYNGDSIKVLAEDINNKGQIKEITGDYVLIATGRRSFTKGLNLEGLGIKVEKNGKIPVGKSLQTKIPGIYAIGDTVEGPMLAHKGVEEGIAAVEIICGEPGHINHNVIPNVVYTHPELAFVGETEEEIKAKKIEYNKGKFPFTANSKAKSSEEDNGFVKVLADKNTDKILGVHIIGPNAGELIAECVLAMEYGASSEDIGRTCHAHPSLSEAVKEACLATFDKPLNL